jgi:predicted DNA-binding WGR domain protein
MESLYMRLEACAPTLGRFRAYRIVAGRDLFGVWMVEMTYGRIGTLGRTKALSFDRVEDAVVAVQERLRRRATAPRRIGVAYRVLTVDATLTGARSKVLLECLASSETRRAIRLDFHNPIED